MISGIGGYAVTTQGAGYGQKPQKPDASQMASDLFSTLDAKGRGYLERSDFESAFSKLSASGVSPSAVTAGADALFKVLDGNGDGKLTRQEMTDAIKNIFDQIGKAGGHEGGGKIGGVPPPPTPHGAGGAGSTKEELATIASNSSGGHRRRWQGECRGKRKPTSSCNAPVRRSRPRAIRATPRRPLTPGRRAASSCTRSCS